MILSSIEASIKRKIESIGVPLKDWDIQINYGIKTGYNDAFIIDEATKNLLIEEDPKSAELIRPILRGRDIKRYSYEFKNIYLICTFPSKHYNIDDYPAIKKHLLSFDQRRLEQSGEKDINGIKGYNARKKTGNKWFETQDQINYSDDFNKQKIMYSDINRRLSFCLVNEEFLCNNTVYFISTEKHQKYFLAILNSKIINWYYKTLSVQLGESAVRMFSIYVNRIPIPKIDQNEEKLFSNLVDEYIKYDNSKFDNKIDALFFNLFDLTKEEIAYIMSVS